MLSQCPTCGSPRQGESPYCATCGFDFRSTAASATTFGQAPQSQWGAPVPPPTPTPSQPQWGTPPPPPPAAPWSAPATPPAPQWGAPATQPQQPQWGAPVAPQAPQGYPGQAGAGTCPRCYAQLTPGYPICSNCGLDTRGSAMPPAGASARKGSNTPLLLAAAGIVLVLVAGGLYVMSNRGNTNGSPTPSATPTIVAQASKTPAATASSSVADSAAPTLGDVSPEPAPAGTWTKFTAPDGTWSISFPGTTKPVKQDLSGTGSSSFAMSFWYATDLQTEAVYAVYVIDGGAALKSMGSKAFVDYMSTYMSTYLGGSGGSTVSSKDVILGGQPAKEFVIEAKGQVMTLRLGLVGSKMYMLLESAAPGADVYPQYFMNTLALK